MICSKCGKENNVNAKFCSGCGSVLESVVLKGEKPIYKDTAEEALVSQDEGGIREEEHTENIQSSLDTSVGKEPVATGWIEFSKVCMVVVCIVFSLIGFAVGGVWTQSEDGALLFGVMGFGISLPIILWQALITAICENLYTNVENMNILIKKVQVLSEQIERQNESMKEQREES